MQQAEMFFQNRFIITLLLALLSGVWQRSVRASQSDGRNVVVVGGARYTVIGESEDDQFDFSFRLTSTHVSPKVELLVCCEDASNFYRLVIAENEANLFRRMGNDEKKLLAGTGRLTLSKQLHIIIRRRQSMFYVAINGQSALEVMDSTFRKGRIALKEGCGATSDARYQPVNDIRFSDDFMRTEKEQELGVWQRVKGYWKFHSVRETNPNADFTRSVNPFSLGLRAASSLVSAGNTTTPDVAVLTAGYSFWVDYDFSVSLKSSGGVAGLIFNYQGERDYYLIRWDMSSPFRRPSRMELVKVKPSGKSILAQGFVTCASEQWYRLGARTLGRRMQVVLDGDVVFDVVDRDAIGGRVGLYTEGTKEALFDDITVTSNHRYIFDRMDTWARNGSPQGGQWGFALNSESSIVGASGPHFLMVNNNATGQYLFGDRRWQGAIVNMRFRNPSKKGWVGIGFAFRDAKNYSVLRWSPDANGQSLQVMRVRNGTGSIVASSPTAFSPGEWHHLELDFSERGRIRAYADGLLKIRVPTDGWTEGQCSLYASGAKGTMIDNVTVAFEKAQGREQVVSNEIFRSDPFMLLWSAEKGDWFPARGRENAYWHKGDFYGPFALTLPLIPGTQVNVASVEQNFSTGYELSLAADADSRMRLVLRRQREIVAQRSFDRAGEDTFTLHKEGEFLWVDAGQKEVLSYHDPQPLRGTHVGLRLTTATDLDKAKLSRYHVIDHLFEVAPADWVRIGIWEITNRFSCTPTWSHMSARSPDKLAVLWNKYCLEGDFTIEYYAGMRMQATRPLSYPRTGDINISFCCDGRDLSSGYSYIVGAWDRGWTSKWTQLLRGSEVVQQTDRYLIPRVREGLGGRAIDVPLISEGRPIHGAWYYIKVRKIGNRIECYFDNERVLTYEDKNPLKGKHFALWTQDNEIVIARMKISYEHVSTPSRLQKPEPPLKLPPEAGVYIRVNSPTHPGMNYDFENSFQDWATTDPEQGALLEIDTTTAASGKSSLKLTNVNTGGDFGVRVPVPYGLDALKVSELSFNYKMPRDARVNLYLKIRGSHHFIEFTGPSNSSPLLPKIGKIEGVQQDKQWRRATFDLANSLRELYPRESNLMLDELVIGNRHEGYLRAGFGGNKEKSTYWLDDFRLVGSSPHPPIVQWASRSMGVIPVSVTQYLLKVDRKPDTDLSGGEMTSDTRRELSGLDAGRWYVHIKGKDEQGHWTPTTHFGLNITNGKWGVASVDPPANSLWGGSPVTVRLQSDDNDYPLCSGTALTVNEKVISGGEMQQWLRYDAGKREVVIHLAHAPLNLANGQKVDLRLHLVRPGEQSVDYAWSYTVDWSKDTTPPRRVRLADYPYSDFSDDTGSFRSSDPGAVLTLLDRRDGVGDKSSLEIISARLGSNMQVTAWERPFTAGKYPILCFDYRIPQEVHADIVLGTIGQATHLVFADTDTSTVYQTLGTMEGIVRDDQWRHAEVNLYQALARQPFNRKMFDVASVFFGDYGYAGTAPGSGYHLDNFQFVPVVNGKKGFACEYLASDFSGIKGYSVKWSANPTDSPDSTINVTPPSQICSVAEEGIQYLHIRAQDNAGNWSETAHYRFVIDNSPPTIGKPVPGNNEPFGSSRLILPVSDAGHSGIDPASLFVSVNEKEYPLEEFVTHWNLEENTITWEWSLVSGFSDQPVPDGTEVRFVLKPVKDFASNEAPPLTWTSRLAYASDKESPVAPEVKTAGQNVLSYDTFTRNLGDWDDWGGRRSFDLSRYYDPEKRDYVLLLRPGGDRRGSGVYVRKSGYDVSRYPFVTFEYKFSGSSKVQLLCLVGGQWRSLALTGPSQRFASLGEVPGILQDGRWHVVTIDLLTFLRQKLGGTGFLSVDNLSIGEEGSTGQYLVDNFAIHGYGNPIPAFQWKAFDPTGIRGFSYQLDQKPDTVPDDVSEGNEREKTFQQLTPGQWYLHLRAQDGAGNWSAPVHYPYFVK